MAIKETVYVKGLLRSAVQDRYLNNTKQLIKWYSKMSTRSYGTKESPDSDRKGKRQDQIKKSYLVDHMT